MKNLLKSIFTLLMIMVSYQTNASSQYSSRITSLHTVQNSDGSSLTYFALDTSNPRSTLPACTSNPIWVINTSSAMSDIAKSQVSLLLMAFSMGRPINVIGMGVCNFYPGIETASDIWVTN
ncbi:MAG: hypothetical protein V4525_08020 [Pseudomonadota bacterium]